MGRVKTPPRALGLVLAALLLSAGCASPRETFSGDSGQGASPASSRSGSSSSAARRRAAGSVTAPAPAADGPSAFPFGQRTKTNGCQTNGAYADSSCTPGAIFANATTDEVCRPGYSRSVRNVSLREKDAIYAEYGIRTHATGQYEVDHLISLELGGSNDPANLWPEPADPPPGFHQKDIVENYLHSQVCNNGEPIAQAQREVAQQWLAVYDKLTPAQRDQFRP